MSEEAKAIAKLLREKYPNEEVRENQQARGYFPRTDIIELPGLSLAVIVRHPRHRSYAVSLGAEGEVHAKVSEIRYAQLVQKKVYEALGYQVIEVSYN